MKQTVWKVEHAVNSPMIFHLFQLDIIGVSASAYKFLEKQLTVCLPSFYRSVSFHIVSIAYIVHKNRIQHSFNKFT